MATFAKPTFSYASYAAFRPSYPNSLYNTILTFHQGSKNLCVDLGCGHGVVTRAFATHFARVIGTDPSSGMVAQARAVTASKDFPNVEFQEAKAERLTKIENGSADIVVAGQAAHWFDYPRLWPELRRVLRPGGTMAFWGYTDHVFVDYPTATQLLHQCTYSQDNGDLGPYWVYPGRGIVEGKLRDIKPPEDEWEQITRLEYEPGTKGPGSGQGMLFMSKQMTAEDCKEYVRTWSAYDGWKEAHPQQKRRAEGGSGDVVDRLFDQMADAEGWTSGDQLVEVEMGSGLLMARRA